MIRAARSRNASPAVGGFTLVELLIYMVLSSAVVAAVFRVLISQSRHFRKQLEVTDVQETLRSAVGVLVFELQQAAPGRGDLVTIAPQSVALRSVKGSGIICVVGSAVEKYGVAQPLGRLAVDGTDSLLIWDRATASWVAREILNITDGPGSGPLSSCDWGGSSAPAKVIHVRKVGAGDGQVGATVQRFQHVVYEMIAWNGRWWLGRRVNGAAAEVMTGPLEAPTDSGSVLHYYDASGAETADPAQVARVEIAIREESQGTTSSRRDSAFTSVLLRNQ